MTKSITKTLLHLLKDFKSTEYVTEIDFIQNCINNNRFSSEDVIIDYFLKLTQCEEFLNKIAKDFIKSKKLIRVNEENVKILIFFLLFVLDQKNVEGILENPVFYTIPLLEFLCTEEKYPNVAKWATQYFDNEFVIHDILEPLMSRAEAFKIMIRFIEQEAKKKIPVSRVTIPKPLNITGFVVSPPPPANTPNVRKSESDLQQFQSKHRVVTFDLIQKKIEKVHNKHFREALTLLKQIRALKVPVNRTSQSTRGTEESQTVVKRFKPTKLPPKKDVEIKRNAATTLRDAARLLKEQEEEINRIQNIVKGGCCTQQIEAALIEERKNHEKSVWQDIQRKHLEGLITFEESILAKKKLLEDNRAKFLEIQAEKMNMYQKLHESKEKEQEKVKAQVEKTHKEKEEAREMEKKFLEKKLEEARMKAYELREMLKKREEEKAAELANKMEIIQEIKSIHEINMKMNEARREFDPTETTNLGLLCEMSLAELRERLAVEKMKMCQETEEKRQRVQTQKRQQQEMIEKYKEFIDNTRKAPKMVIEPVYRPPALEENDEIKALRRQLKEKRNLRISM